MNVTPEIRNLDAQPVLYARETGVINGDFTQAAQTAFARLMGFLQSNNLADKWSYCLGITPDDPNVVSPADCRYDAGVVLHEGVNVELNDDVAIQTLSAGRYAVFAHHGPYNTLWQTWNAAYRDWLPMSGEQLRDAVPYEIYLNDASETKPEALETEIFIPIQ